MISKRNLEGGNGATNAKPLYECVLVVAGYTQGSFIKQVAHTVDLLVMERIG